MIISAENLVLTAQEPLNTPVFGWKSLATPGNISATSENPAYPAANMANPSTALFWRAAEEGSPGGAPASDQFITVSDLEGLIDYLAVAAHNLGSSQNAISVEISDGGSPETWSEVAPPVIPQNDDPLLFRFAPQMASAVRLRIQPGLLIPQIAVVYVGKLLVCERGTSADYTPINLARTTRVLTGKSETGQFLGRYVLSESREAPFSLQWLRPEWYRREFDPFLRWAQEMPFFIAHQPQDEPGDVGFCWLTNDPHPTFDFNTGRVSIDLQLNGTGG